MTVLSTRLERARDLHSVDSNQYTDANALIDINALIREAVLLTKDNWDYGLADTVISQNEYKAEQFGTGATAVDFLQVNKVWAKYGTEYVKAEKVSYYEFDENTSYTERTPIYYFKDGSVFLYPAFDSVVSEGVKVEASFVPNDIALTDEDTDIDLDLWIVDAIFEYGLGYYIEMEKGNKNEARADRQSYRTELSRKKGMAGNKVNDTRANNLPQDINNLI